MSSSWHLYLLGALRAQRGQEAVTRFRSQKFGALLAYLALFPQRVHSREELADRFWPDAEMEVGRTNLRTALTSLRRQLEPPGTPAGSVLVTEGRTHIHLAPDALTTDVRQFELALASAQRAAASDQQIQLLTQAVDIYAGPLLPGLYEEWVLGERDRLADAYLRALRQLAVLQEQAGSWDQALDAARRATVADPLREDAQADVIRLLMASGQPTLARRQYDEFAQRLRDKLDTQPSTQTRALLENAAIVLPLNTRPVLLPSRGSDTRQPKGPSSPLHLPLAATRFFGREDEIDALHHLLRDDENRLVTITGIGGNGKTRVAIEAARSLETAFSGGIWFVPLADVSDGEQFPEAIAKVLEIPLSSDTSALKQVISALDTASAAGPTLLVLDNLEQLVETVAAPFVQPLLHQVAALKILATSRQRLLLEAEHEFPLLPLATPAYPGTPERLLEFPSVQLFVSRAQTIRADFQLSTRNASSVALLCARLEGIPLALELAAAWAQTLAPHQMLERMDKRFDLLMSRRRDLSPRHRTMRAVIEASYHLLPADVRRFFTQLSVFQGGWSLEAAEEVTGVGVNALDYLATLQEHSLIVTEQYDEGTRFRMLETLRAFAGEEHDSSDDALPCRHARFFAEFAKNAESERNTPTQNAALDRLEQEHANLRTVLSWCRSDAGDAEIGLRLTGHLWWFWMLRGYLAEGRQHLAIALARAEQGPASWDRLRAVALNGAGCLARLQGDLAAARPHLENARALFEQRGDTLGLGMVLQNLGIVAQDNADYEVARQYYETSLEHRRSSDDKEGIANVLNSLGVLAFELGDYATSRARLEECLTLRRSLGQSPRVPHLVNLGNVCYFEGNLAGSRTWLEQAVDLARRTGHRQGLATALGGLAMVATQQQQFPLAWSQFAESLQIFLELGDSGSFAQTLEGAALLEVAQQQFTDAARYLGTADAIRQVLEMPLPANERPAYDQAMVQIRDALGQERLREAWLQGENTEPAIVLQTVQQQAARAAASASRSASDDAVTVA